MLDRFEEAIVEDLAAAEEIEVESHRPDGRARRTIVWVVVDGDQVYVRSIRGRKGVWYRELRASPAAAVHVSGHRISARARPVEDADVIERVTEAYRRKYGRSPYLDGVVKPESLSGTLRLEPAQRGGN